ncbi:MAG: hypothetical protein R3B95_21385 [Nitrospirales bacterium]|nr:hypothetical protein [Nitrospirales bacterium]
MNKLFNGLPSLIGVIAGIGIYSSKSLLAWAIPVGIIILSYGILRVGKCLVLKCPRTGMLIIESWILSAISVVSMTTAFIIWLTVHSRTWFPVSQDEIDTVSGAFIGAVTAYFAFVWIKDINDTTGPFWPSTHFKQALSKFQLSELIDSKEVDAAFLDRVRNNGPNGWGIKARWGRVLILAEYLKRKTGKGS